MSNVYIFEISIESNDSKKKHNTLQKVIHLFAYVYLIISYIDEFKRKHEFNNNDKYFIIDFVSNK